MFAAVKVLGRVLILRGIAAAHVSALQAKPQVHPCIPDLHAIFADVLIGGGELNVVEMAAC
jgi:hypothetical protein